MRDPKSLPQPDNAGEFAPKKPSSSAKIEANRRNSSGSPGPKTTQGKKNSSRNARKHNLLTKDVVITTGAGKENEDEFASMHAGLRESWTPVGYEENRGVAELAACDWRTRRARRCENAAVTHGSEISHQNHELSESEQEILNLRPANEARYELLQSSRGINYLLRAVEHVRKELMAGGDPWSAPQWLLPDGVWKGTIEIQARADTLAKEAASLTALRVQVEQAEADKVAERDLAAIPEKDMLDKILRYENGNRRHRYHVEARLDELQERRRRQDAKTGLETNSDPESPRKT